MKKFLDAAAKTILLFAMLHGIVLFVVFLKTGDLAVFNIAGILEIDRILPVNITGVMPVIVSLLFVALVYCIVYFRFTK